MKVELEKIIKFIKDEEEKTIRYALEILTGTCREKKLAIGRAFGSLASGILEQFKCPEPDDTCPFSYALIRSVSKEYEITLAQAMEELRENYFGEYYSLASFGEAHMRKYENIDTLSEDVSFYINFEEYAKDLINNGHIVKLGNHYLEADA